MTTTRWWWIRHAPVPNPEGRIYGQRDLPADTSNAAAFRTLAVRMPRGAVWFATSLVRTRATAATIAAAMAEPPPQPVIAPDLIEQNFGDWQGRTYAELGSYGLGDKTGEGHKFWVAPAHATPPGGESFVAVMRRVALAIDRIGTEHRGRDIVAVAHGGTIRAALAHALGLDPEAALSLSVDTLSLTRVDRVDTPFGGRPWRVGPVNLPPV